MIRSMQSFVEILAEVVINGDNHDGWNFGHDRSTDRLRNQ